MTNQEFKSTIHQAAQTWWEGGCNVIPILANGTKKPWAKWGEYIHKRVTQWEVDTWFKPRPDSAFTYGIGIVCGAASGGLEMLELEGRAASGDDLTRIAEMCEQYGIAWLWDLLLDQGYAEWTPSGGLHFLYRITDHEVPGNTKVARRPATEEELLESPKDSVKVLSETRGEGGYVVVAPSGGAVHKSGDSWSTVAGTMGQFLNVLWEDRCTLIAAVTAALDVPLPREAPAAPTPRSPLSRPQGSAARPGDAFNERATWTEILEPHGWQVHSQRGAETFWTRPGKDVRDGHSASTGYAGDADRLYVFSSATEFPTETPLSKFAAYALLEHRNDFAAAARTLAARGFGERTGFQQPIQQWTGSGTGVVSASAFTSTGSSAAALPGAEVDMVDASQVLQPSVTQSDVVRYDRDGVPLLDLERFSRMVYDDWGVLDLYQDMVKPVLRYNIDGGTWMGYQDGVWEPTESQHEQAAMTLGNRLARWLISTPAEDRDPALAKAAKSLSTLAKARALASAAQHKKQLQGRGKDWNPRSTRHLLPCSNGTLDLNTGTLHDWSPEHMVTRKTSVAYEPDAAGPRWQQFVEEVMPDQATRDYVQRALGYTLAGDADERVIFMIHGGSGSGKSAFLEAIYRTLGTYAGVASESTLLPRRDESGPSDALHALKGRRFVKMSETTAGSSLNENLVKSITGMDTQTTRPLYGKLEEWDVEFTIWLGTNHLPRISATDDAVWKRIKPILFPGKFVKDNGDPINRADKGIGRQLAEQEGSAILNWILAGLAAYREQGLDQPDTVGAELEAYRDEVDSTRQFVLAAAEDGVIKHEKGLKVRSQELYRAYVTWCDENQIRHVSNRVFSQRMLANGFEKTREAAGMVWTDIGLVGWLAASQAAGMLTGWGGKRMRT